MSKIRWLHISDLHYGYDSYITAEMRTKMITALPTKLIADMGCPEYLFITGDLRHGKTTTKFPKEIVNDITKLMTAFNIPSNRVHIVMGNHDAVRDTSHTDIAPILREKYADGNLDRSRMKTLEKSQHKFYKIYKAICKREPSPYHTLVKETDFNIICLNTAFSCSDDNDDGKLIVGMKLVQETLKDMDTSKPGIVLAHHGFESLQLQERMQLETKLKDSGALLYLCGHEHFARYQNIAILRQRQPLYEYVCGTGMDKLKTGQPATMVVFMGELDTEQKNGYIKAWKWDPGTYDWLPYSDLSHAQSGVLTGIHSFPDTSLEKIIPRELREEALEQYRKYISSECSEIPLDGLPVDTIVGSKTLKLEKIFTPTEFKKIQRLEDKPPENFVVPSRQLGFRRVILAGPGGGKTTFLKRLAMAYAFPEHRADPEIDDKLPDRELLPIWIRCRDLKEKATLSLTEIINCIPSWAKFRRDCPELIDAFHTEVSERLEKGELLLLIDGLDEIANTGKCKRFAEEIVQFAELYPTANIIVTSRISGFEYVSDGKLGAFPRLQISELSDDDIRLLCCKWHKIIYGDREENIMRADALTDTILNHERIRVLAGSPLLLMTLLLVQRRVGRLPTRRVTLYHECVKVLIDSWNIEGFGELDWDETMCQLSYVAFEMMRQGVQIIGRQDLVALLKAVRKEQDWLSPKLEPIGTFLKRVELRSGLLTKRGYRPTDSGELEAEYEFQHHLTFQEYLAAFAVAKGYYAGTDQKHSFLESLENFYDDENKEEVILLVTAREKPQIVTKIVESIIHRINCTERKEEKDTVRLRGLRNLLLKIVRDECKLREETRKQIFETVISDTVCPDQAPFFCDALKSTVGEEFLAFLKNADRDDFRSIFDYLQIGKGVDSIGK